MQRSVLMLSAVLLFSLTGCATSPPVPPAPRYTVPDLVVDKLWGWEGTETSVELFEVSDPKRFTLRLKPDGTALANFDCNHGSGTYRISAGKLTFSAERITRISCPTGDPRLALQFGNQLLAIAGFYLQNGKLYLEMPMDGGTMQFQELHH